MSIKILENIFRYQYSQKKEGWSVWYIFYTFQYFSKVSDKILKMDIHYSWIKRYRTASQSKYPPVWYIYPTS